MTVSDIEYVVPKTLKEACSLALKHKEGARIVAGGTDVVVRVKRKLELPRYVIDIGHIPELDYVVYDGSELRIGALAKIHSIELSQVIKDKFNILTQAASKLGSFQVRNMATLAGNLCNAAPSAETAPPLLVLNARAKIAGTDGERVVPLESFFTGPSRTVLKPGELLAEIQVSDVPPQTGGIYFKHNVKKAMGLATVGVAALVTMDGDVLSDVRIALGAVSPTPVRARKSEEILKGKPLDDALLKQAGQCACGECSPINDIRSSAGFRSHLVGVLVARAVKEAAGQAKKL